MSSEQGEYSQSNFGYMISIIILLLMLVAAVMFSIVNYFDHKSNYIKKEELNRFYVEKIAITFDDLPTHIQNLYTAKRQITDNQKFMDENIKMIEKSTISDEFNSIRLVTQMKCKNLISGQYNITSSCKKEIQEKLSKLDKSMIYEIIPIISPKDFSFLQLITDNTKDNPLYDEDLMDDFGKYSNAGLAQYRLNEAVWLLKKRFGDDVKIRTSSFHMFTNSESGFIIKVFNKLK